MKTSVAKLFQMNTSDKGFLPRWRGGGRKGEVVCGMRDEKNIACFFFLSLIHTYHLLPSPFPPVRVLKAKLLLIEVQFLLLFNYTMPRTAIHIQNKHDKIGEKLMRFMQIIVGFKCNRQSSEAQHSQLHFLVW